MAQSTREFYSDAIARSPAINASAFAEKIGVTRSSLSLWKAGKSHPSDKTMLKIALIADLDPVEALALLNLWRCDEDAKSTYQRLLDVAKSTALKSFPYIIGASLALGANFEKAHAFSGLEGKQTENISHKVSLYHHYAIFRETFSALTKVLLRLIRRLKPQIYATQLGSALWG